MYLAPEEVMEALLPAVWLTDGGVVCVDFGREAAITLVAAQLAYERHRKLVPQRRSPVLVYCNPTLRSDPKARRFLCSTAVRSVTAATAVVVRNPLVRVIGNFYLAYAALPYPCRLFPNPEAAMRWLLPGNATKA